MAKHSLQPSCAQFMPDIEPHYTKLALHLYIPATATHTGIINACASATGQVERTSKAIVGTQECTAPMLWHRHGTMPHTPHRRKLKQFTQNSSLLCVYLDMDSLLLVIP